MVEKLALLLTEGIGPVRYRKLINKFKSVDNIIKAKTSELLEIIPETLISKVRNLDFKRANEEIKKAKSLNVKILILGDEDFPEELSRHEFTTAILYAWGNLELLKKLKFAIVGTRKPTEYGKNLAYKFSNILSQKLVIVSGGAIGIDTYAHLGSIPNTIVVLGSGINVLHPRSNENLFKRIYNDGGLIISQFPIDFKPSKETFPIRNLTISALSLGVLLVEGSEDSGALITAKFAFELNKEVFTIPNRLDIPQAKGPIKLLKQNIAHIIESPEDILNEFKLGKVNIENNVELDDFEKLVFERIVGRVCFDDLLEIFKDYSKLITALTSLEIKGLIRQSGGFYERV
ncbi:MAG: DNA-processing protein DprA [candidate division WOR-3 bacterium]